MAAGEGARRDAPTSPPARPHRPLVRAATSMRWMGAVFLVAGVLLGAVASAVTHSWEVVGVGVATAVLYPVLQRYVFDPGRPGDIERFGELAGPVPDDRVALARRIGLHALLLVAFCCALALWMSHDDDPSGFGWGFLVGVGITQLAQSRHWRRWQDRHGVVLLDEVGWRWTWGWQTVDGLNPSTTWVARRGPTAAPDAPG